MSRKVLFVATVLRMHVLVFHLPYMRWFQEQGYEVHLCCANDTPDPHPQVPYCDRWVELPFSRSPFSADNREVFRRLKQLIDAEDYALIHCNTPVGGLLGRLAARAARKRGTRVVYTAHGFHFFTGAPLKNWLLYYPAERLLSRWTDLLITINGEEKQMKSFSGSKAIGVNPNCEYPQVAVALARYLGSADAQKAHYEMRNVVPCNEELLSQITDDALVTAQNDTFNNTSIIQPFVKNMSNYWTPAENFGKSLVNGEVTHDNAAEMTEKLNTSMNTSAVE